MKQSTVGLCIASSLWIPSMWLLGCLRGWLIQWCTHHPQGENLVIRVTVIINYRQIWGSGIQRGWVKCRTSLSQIMKWWCNALGVQILKNIIFVHTYIHDQEKWVTCQRFSISSFLHHFLVLKLKMLHFDANPIRIGQCLSL